MKKLVIGAAAIAFAGAVVSAQNTQINGAGATFPAPIYTKWFAEYNKLHSNVQINYQPIGSGGGINQISHKTVFFGASDGPMTPEQMNGAQGGKILHFPTVLGGVVPMYNIPGFSGQLKFTGPLLADIYLGKITKWNDPAITKLNPGTNLPATDITVVHRSDGSGTTYIWCDYLSKVSPAYKKRVGVATSVNWPVGVGGLHSDGVAGLVSQTPGAIAYNELVYAIQNNIKFGSVQNMSGKFVQASLEGVTAAAAAAAKSMPADFRVSITNAPGDDVYPISSFTWLLIPSEIKDPAKKKAITEFLSWMLTTGQKDCEGLSYAPLPKAVVAKEQKQIALIK
jgi:phosphate transport system substrate-binding protein